MLSLITRLLVSCSFVIAVVPVQTAAQCVTANAGGGWINSPFQAQSGTFTATFDATPSLSHMNSVVGISQAAGTMYSDFANLVAFNGTDGVIAARNDAVYQPLPPATNTIPYSGGTTYHFRLVVNIPAHTYSIFVTPPGGPVLTVGSDFKFRTEQQGVASLANYGVFNGATSGSLQVCNFAISSGSGGMPDFSLSVPPPASQTITAGGSTTYSVNVGAINGFSGSVALTISGLPSGATGTFAPNPVNGPGASTLTVSTNASTPANSYSLLIAGTSGSLSHSQNATLNVNPAATPDFTLSASPASQTVSPGSNTTYTVTVTPQNGFNGNVAFSLAGLPAAATAGFAPTSVTGSGTSTLTVSTTTSTPTGASTLAITGDSGSLSHNAHVNLNVSSGQTVLNVRDFGATGNGTTLDTAAFQRALDACATHSPCTLNAPPGT